MMLFTDERGKESLYVSCHATDVQVDPSDYRLPTIRPTGVVLRIGLLDADVDEQKFFDDAETFAEGLNRPSGLAISPDGTRLYVTSHLLGTDRRGVFVFSGPNSCEKGRFVRVLHDLNPAITQSEIKHGTAKIDENFSPWGLCLVDCEKDGNLRLFATSHSPAMMANFDVDGGDICPCENLIPFLLSKNLDLSELHPNVLLSSPR
eukprot:CAMPEP_0197532446 /NCGR_PEP_ID=MMETSP1318-20131121/39714_1 /TAXON_ID=552666 /ORGANISM="Partenskyella glossopodia, Strain RCC365" /LENGTH=204 /DNA_ID=CAMNT_0043089001 /DNA_START=271 /DNA_END=885 /DNA_ORIENTATION=-